jgi:hypothetical protein
MVVLSVIFGYVVKLDVDQFRENLDKGAVYVYEDKLAYETEPFKLIDENNITALKEMIGNKTKALRYNFSALQEIDGDALSMLEGNYTKQVLAFKDIVESENSTLFVMQQIKQKNIEIYPGSALVVCSNKCPDFMIKIIAK